MIPWKIVCDVIFTVRKSSRTTKAAHDRTALTADTAFDLVAVNGTVALGKLVTRFENGDL